MGALWPTYTSAGRQIVTYTESSRTGSTYLPLLLARGWLPCMVGMEHAQPKKTLTFRAARFMSGSCSLAGGFATGHGNHDAAARTPHAALAAT